MGNLWVLQVLRLPARLTVEAVGVMLGFYPDSIRHLVEAGLLEGLGLCIAAIQSVRRNNGA
jgi:hypothetical protein